MMCYNVRMWKGWSVLKPFALGCLVLAAGCAASGVDGDQGGGNPELARLAEQLAPSLCDCYRTHFGEAADFNVGQLFSFTAGGSCEPLVEGVLRNETGPRLATSIESGRIVLHNDQMTACMTALQAVGCRTPLSGLELPECEQLIQGQVVAGESCDHQLECGPGLFCDLGSSCPGTCTARRSAGTDCQATLECEAGSMCSDGTCVEEVGEGQPCGGPSEKACAETLTCAGDSSTEAGSCIAVEDFFGAGLDEACNFSEGPLCTQGLSCQPDDGELVCAQKAAPGGSCVFGFPDPCPTNQYCDRPAESLEGNCTALPGDGEACLVDNAGTSRDFRFGTGCAPMHACVNGTCKALQANGGSCDGAAECLSGHCEGGVCAAPPQCEA